MADTLGLFLAGTAESCSPMSATQRSR